MADVDLGHLEFSHQVMLHSNSYITIWEVDHGF